MKKDLHPKYEKSVIKCACGNEIVTRSTVPGEMHVELCSACHPFYTGKQKFVDTAGRVDKFRARLEKAQSKTAPTKKETTVKNEKSNTEKLAEIKKEIVADKTEKSMAASQETNSDTEAAAAEELKEN